MTILYTFPEIIGLVKEKRQSVEMKYKGRINKRLFIVSENANGDVVIRESWSRNDPIVLENIINKNIGNPDVVVGYVTNEYSDWKIEFYKNT